MIPPRPRFPSKSAKSLNSTVMNEKGCKGNLFGGKKNTLQSNPVSHRVRMSCPSFVLVAATAVAASLCSSFVEAGVRGGGRRHAALFNGTQHPSKKTTERHGRRTQNVHLLFAERVTIKSSFCVNNLPFSFFPQRFFLCSTGWCFPTWSAHQTAHHHCKTTTHFKCYS